MKVFVRLLKFTTEDEKERMRRYLNDLGFYCLTRDTDLEVYAIKETKFVLGFKI